MLLCKLLKFLIQYSCTPPGPGLSYLLPYFLNVNMHVIVYCQLSKFILRLQQSVFSVLRFLAWSHISLHKRLLSFVSTVTLSLFVPSNSLNNFFWFDSNYRFCLYCSVLLSYLSRLAPTATNLCRISL